MADFIYCGTDPPVGAVGTQKLLLGPYKAIWYPPPWLAVEPAAGDQLWLVWRSSPDAVPLLLGGGRIRVTNDGRALWTERTLTGVRATARGLGYGGPSNMAFLHLTDVVEPHDQPPVNIGQISSKLNVATPQQTQLLTQVLPI
jgi:hypothetical protein